MSRAKREQKTKINLKVWIPIICIIIVGITFYMIYDIQNKIENIDAENQNNEYENTVENEEKNSKNIVDENLTNEDETVNSTENITQETTNVTNSSNVSSAPAQPAITDKKQKAIELVRKKWGKDDTVNYVFDYVNENGEYVIAVKDKVSASVKYYFRVNLETEQVELD